MAMGALASGAASTKTEARKLAGLGQEALHPRRLEALAARRPEIASAIQSIPMLDWSADVDGAQVTFRDALTDCAMASLRVLKRLGGSWDVGEGKDAPNKLKMAKTLLLLCRDCGLWSENTGNTMPAEIEAMERRQADTMSVESVTQVAVTHWTRDHRRHDGIGPTARRLHAEAQLLAQSPVVEADAQVE